MTKLIDQFFGKDEAQEPDLSICGEKVSKQDLLDLLDVFNMDGYGVLVRILSAIKQNTIESTLSSVELEEPRIIERYKGSYLTVERLLGIPVIVHDMLSACAKNVQPEAKGVDSD